MANTGAWAVETGDHLIQFGVSPKTGVEGHVPFARSFGAPPSVVVSPYWEGRSSEVGHAETVDSVGTGEFVLMSNNGASDYFVSWIAAGPREGVSRPRLGIEAGDMYMSFGGFRRAEPAALLVDLGPVYAAAPNVQVSPFWEGQRSGVGHAETIEFVDRETFSIVGGNAAPNYRVSWIAAGPKAGVDPTSAFEIGDVLVVTGLATKTGPLARQALGPASTRFAAPPTLILSPLWKGQGAGVGHAETLNRVERTTGGDYYFETVSGNAAGNYCVSWLAIGRRA